MSKLLSPRSMLILAVILASIVLVVYLETLPRLAPGQEPLRDITRIETLRTQFHRDEGFPRLILLVSPT